jgi:hypothetical protein
MGTRFRMGFRWSAALAVSAVAFIALASSSRADEKPSVGTINEVFGMFGVEQTADISPKTCKIALTLDRSKFIEGIPVLKKFGILNEGLTQTAINSKPFTLAMAFAIQVASAALQQAYENNATADKCAFQQTVRAVDDYGNDKTIKMFSFSFSREIANKIKWEKFQSSNLLKIAPQFAFSPEYMSLVKSEAD